MKHGTENPPENVLPAGIVDAQIEEAVRRSGYPLQSVVAAAVRGQRFSVQQEWSYVDADTGGARSLDLLALQDLYGLESQRRVRPILALLIECKQSALPYVFFRAEAPTWLPNLPAIVGLRGEELEISTDDSLSTWSLSITT